MTITSEQLLDLPPAEAGQLVASMLKTSVGDHPAPTPVYEFTEENRAKLAAVCEKLGADLESALEGKLANSLKPSSMPPGDERTALIHEYLNTLDESCSNKAECDAAKEARAEAGQRAFDEHGDLLLNFLTSCAQREETADAEAAVTAYQKSGGLVNLLVRVASENKTDPIIGPFLAKLRGEVMKREAETERAAEGAEAE